MLCMFIQYFQNLRYLFSYNSDSTYFLENDSLNRCIRADNRCDLNFVTGSRMESGRKIVLKCIKTFAEIEAVS